MAVSSSVAPKEEGFAAKCWLISAAVQVFNPKCYSLPNCSLTAVVLGSHLFLKPSVLPSSPAPHSVLSRWGCRGPAVFTVLISTPTLSLASYTRVQDPCTVAPWWYSSSFKERHQPPSVLTPVPSPTTFLTPSPTPPFRSHLFPCAHSYASQILLFWSALWCPSESFTCAASPDSPEAPIMPLKLPDPASSPVLFWLPSSNSTLKDIFISV